MLQLTSHLPVETPSRHVQNILLLQQPSQCFRVTDSILLMPFQQLHHNDEFETKEDHAWLWGCWLEEFLHQRCPPTDQLWTWWLSKNKCKKMALMRELGSCSNVELGTWLKGANCMMAKLFDGNVGHLKLVLDSCKTWWGNGLNLLVAFLTLSDRADWQGVYYY